MSKSQKKLGETPPTLDDLAVAVDAADRRRDTAMSALQRFGAITPRSMATDADRDAHDAARQEYVNAEHAANEARRTLAEAEWAARHAVPEAERRRNLAAAIAARDDAEAALQAARGAGDNVHRAVADAADELDAASAAVTAALQADAAAIETAAAVGAPAPPATVRAAREREVAARDALEAARTAAAAVEARVTSAEANAARAGANVTTAVASLIDVPIAGLYRKAENLMEEVSGICAVLGVLLEVDQSPDRSDPRRKAVEQFIEYRGDAPSGDPSIAAWRETLAALAADAGAPFPPMEGGARAAT